MRKCQNAMKKRCILLFAAAMLTVTGCVFFRKLSRRPTSDLIEVKLQEMLSYIEAKAAAQKGVE